LPAALRSAHARAPGNRICRTLSKAVPLVARGASVAAGMSISSGHNPTRDVSRGRSWEPCPRQVATARTRCGNRRSAGRRNGPPRTPATANSSNQQFIDLCDGAGPTGRPRPLAPMGRCADPSGRIAMISRRSDAPALVHHNRCVPYARTESPVNSTPRRCHPPAYQPHAPTRANGQHGKSRKTRTSASAGRGSNPPPPARVNAYLMPSINRENHVQHTVGRRFGMAAVSPHRKPAFVREPVRARLHHRTNMGIDPRHVRVIADTGRRCSIVSST